MPGEWKTRQDKERFRLLGPLCCEIGDFDSRTKHKTLLEYVTREAEAPPMQNYKKNQWIGRPGVVDWGGRDLSVIFAEPFSCVA